jgi:hypothetical protein
MYFPPGFSGDLHRPNELSPDAPNTPRHSAGPAGKVPGLVVHGAVGAPACEPARYAGGAGRGHLGTEGLEQLDRRSGGWLGGVLIPIGSGPISEIRAEHPVTHVRVHGSLPRKGVHNGGSARDYLPGFAWLVAAVFVRRASGCPYFYASAPAALSRRF